MPWFDEILLDDLDDELVIIHENSDHKKEK